MGGATAPGTSANSHNTVLVSVFASIGLLILIVFLGWLSKVARPANARARLIAFQVAEQRETSQSERRCALDDIPVVTYAAVQAVQGEEKERLEAVREEEVGCGAEVKTCSVCTEKFLGSENVRVLPCGHVYHQRCIDMWVLRFASSVSCPLW